MPEYEGNASVTRLDGYDGPIPEDSNDKKRKHALSVATNEDVPNDEGGENRRTVAEDAQSNTGSIMVDNVSDNEIQTSVRGPNLPRFGGGDLRTKILGQFINQGSAGGSLLGSGRWNSKR